MNISKSLLRESGFSDVWDRAKYLLTRSYAYWAQTVLVPFSPTLRLRAQECMFIQAIDLSLAIRIDSLAIN